MKNIRPSAINSYIGRIAEDCENKKKDICERIRICGVQSLSNSELILYLLSQFDFPVKDLDVQEICSLIEKHATGDLLAELKTFSTFSFENIAKFVVAIELGRRFYGISGSCIKSPHDLIPYVQHYALEKQEYFLCATLTGANEIISIHVVSVGTLNKSIIHPREVFANALKDRCASVILCHNHPSGKTEPSIEDIETTMFLIESAKFLGIKVLDHLIITKNDYFSFLQEELI